MFEQSFYIGERFMGSVARHEVRVHGEVQTPLSIGHFCETCGDVWAKGPVTPHRAWDLKWSLCPDCRQHGVDHIRGSLLSRWDHEYNSLLLSCPDIVKWEWERHMDYYQRRIENDG